MNKKGFGKTLEATIAIILILSFIYYFSPKPLTKESDLPENVKEAQKFILEEISATKELRDCVLAAPEGKCDPGCTKVENLVKKHTPPGYAFACEICPTAGTCSSNVPLDKSLYTNSIFISANNPKVVRIYFWEK